MPNEKRSPFVTSGVRFGVPALTTRGMKEAEMQTIGELVGEVYQNLEENKEQVGVRDKVRSLALKFSLYPEWK